MISVNFLLADMNQRKASYTYTLKGAVTHRLLYNVPHEKLTMCLLQGCDDGHTGAFVTHRPLWQMFNGYCIWNSKVFYIFWSIPTHIGPIDAKRALIRPLLD